jgi:hypothetical protein
VLHNSFSAANYHETHLQGISVFYLEAGFFTEFRLKPSYVTAPPKPKKSITQQKALLKAEPPKTY